MTVVPGRQLHVTVLAFSCFVTTQCSMTSALAGGSWLRTSGGAAGGGVAATGCFFAAQPVNSRQTTRQPLLMSIVFALYRQLVDANLGYTSSKRTKQSENRISFRVPLRTKNASARAIFLQALIPTLVRLVPRFGQRKLAQYLLS
jgi:hypothetical protein